MTFVLFKRLVVPEGHITNYFIPEAKLYHYVAEDDIKNWLKGEPSKDMEHRLYQAAQNNQDGVRMTTDRSIPPWANVSTIHFYITLTHN